MKWISYIYIYTHISAPSWVSHAFPHPTRLGHHRASGEVPVLHSRFPLATWCLSGKESACQAGDLGLMPRSGSSPGEGNDNPLQYSCLGDPWTEEPGRLCSLWGCKRVGHDLATKQWQVYIHQSEFPSLSHLPLPTLCPNVRSLYLCLYSCPEIDSFVPCF